MSFVTASHWRCDHCGREVQADTEAEPDGWIHIRWWSADDTETIDVCASCHPRVRKTLRLIGQKRL